MALSHTLILESCTQGLEEMQVSPNNLNSSGEVLESLTFSLNYNSLNANAVDSHLIQTVEVNT